MALFEAWRMIFPSSLQYFPGKAGTRDVVLSTSTPYCWVFGVLLPSYRALGLSTCKYVGQNRT
jgi:hypothetical protein